MTHSPIVRLLIAFGWLLFVSHVDALFLSQRPGDGTKYGNITYAPQTCGINTMCVSNQTNQNNVNCSNFGSNGCNSFDLACVTQLKDGYVDAMTGKRTRQGGVNSTLVPRTDICCPRGYSGDACHVDVGCSIGGCDNGAVCVHPHPTVVQDSYCANCSSGHVWAHDTKTHGWHGRFCHKHKSDGESFSAYRKHTLPHVSQRRLLGSNTQVLVSATGTTVRRACDCGIQWSNGVTVDVFNSNTARAMMMGNYARTTDARFRVLLTPFGYDPSDNINEPFFIKQVGSLDQAKYECAGDQYCDGVMLQQDASTNVTTALFYTLQQSQTGPLLNASLMTGPVVRYSADRWSMRASCTNSTLDAEWYFNTYTYDINQNVTNHTVGNLDVYSGTPVAALAEIHWRLFGHIDTHQPNAACDTSVIIDQDVEFCNATLTVQPNLSRLDQEVSQDVVTWSNVTDCNTMRTTYTATSVDTLLIDQYGMEGNVNTTDTTTTVYTVNGTCVNSTTGGSTTTNYTGEWSIKQTCAPINMTFPNQYSTYIGDTSTLVRTSTGRNNNRNGAPFCECLMPFTTSDWSLTSPVDCAADMCGEYGFVNVTWLNQVEFGAQASAQACTCMHGFETTSCSTTSCNWCTQSLCNAGTNILTANAGRIGALFCQCPPTYKGLFCDEYMCSSVGTVTDPTSNQPTVFRNSSSYDYFCDCVQGYYGILCDVECVNGSFDSATNTCTCNLRGGFNGTACDQPLCDIAHGAYRFDGIGSTHASDCNLNTTMHQNITDGQYVSAAVLLDTCPYWWLHSAEYAAQYANHTLVDQDYGHCVCASPLFHGADCSSDSCNYNPVQDIIGWSGIVPFGRGAVDTSGSIVCKCNFPYANDDSLGDNNNCQSHACGPFGVPSYTATASTQPWDMCTCDATKAWPDVGVYTPHQDCTGASISACPSSCMYGTCRVADIGPQNLDVVNGTNPAMPCCLCDTLSGLQAETQCSAFCTHTLVCETTHTSGFTPTGVNGTEVCACLPGWTNNTGTYDCLVPLPPVVPPETPPPTGPSGTYVPSGSGSGTGSSTASAFGLTGGPMALWAILLIVFLVLGIVVAFIVVVYVNRRRTTGCWIKTWHVMRSVRDWLWFILTTNNTLSRTLMLESVDEDRRKRKARADAAVKKAAELASEGTAGRALFRFNPYVSSALMLVALMITASGVEAQSVCSGQGAIQLYGGTNQCICDSDWSGPSCSIRSCSGNGVVVEGPCSAAGTSPGSSGCCACYSDWGGATCSSRSCSGHGIVQPGSCSAIGTIHGSVGCCACNAGWSGTICSNGWYTSQPTACASPPALGVWPTAQPWNGWAREVDQVVDWLSNTNGYEFMSDPTFFGSSNTLPNKKTPMIAITMRSPNQGGTGQEPSGIHMSTGVDWNAATQSNENVNRVGCFQKGGTTVEMTCSTQLDYWFNMEVELWFNGNGQTGRDNTNGACFYVYTGGLPQWYPPNSDGSDGQAGGPHPGDNAGTDHSSLFLPTTCGNFCLMNGGSTSTTVTPTFPVEGHATYLQLGSAFVVPLEDTAAPISWMYQLMGGTRKSFVTLDLCGGFVDESHNYEMCTGGATQCAMRLATVVNADAPVGWVMPAAGLYNHGVDDGDSFFTGYHNVRGCICNPGSGGQFCELSCSDMNATDPTIVCSGHGGCNYQDTAGPNEPSLWSTNLVTGQPCTCAYNCTCENGYTGDQCEQAVQTSVFAASINQYHACCPPWAGADCSSMVNNKFPFEQPFALNATKICHVYDTNDSQCPGPSLRIGAGTWLYGGTEMFAHSTAPVNEIEMNWAPKTNSKGESVVGMYWSDGVNQHINSWRNNMCNEQMRDHWYDDAESALHNQTPDWVTYNMAKWVGHGVCWPGDQQRAFCFCNAPPLNATDLLPARYGRNGWYGDNCEIRTCTVATIPMMMYNFSSIRPDNITVYATQRDANGTLLQCNGNYHPGYDSADQWGAYDLDTPCDDKVDQGINNAGTCNECADGFGAYAGIYAPHLEGTAYYSGVETGLCGELTLHSAMGSPCGGYGTPTYTNLTFWPAGGTGSAIVVQQITNCECDFPYTIKVAVTGLCERTCYTQNSTYGMNFINSQSSLTPNQYNSIVMSNSSQGCGNLGNLDPTNTTLHGLCYPIAYGDDPDGFNSACMCQPGWNGYDCQTNDTMRYYDPGTSADYSLNYTALNPNKLCGLHGSTATAPLPAGVVLPNGTSLEVYYFQNNIASMTPGAEMHSITAYSPQICVCDTDTAAAAGYAIYWNASRSLACSRQNTSTELAFTPPGGIRGPPCGGPIQGTPVEDPSGQSVDVVCVCKRGYAGAACNDQVANHANGAGVVDASGVGPACGGPNRGIITYVPGTFRRAQNCSCLAAYPQDASVNGHGACYIACPLGGATNEVCSGHGTASAPGQDCTCQCASGYAGLACDQTTSASAIGRSGLLYSCTGRGVASATGGYCICNVGYVGYACELSLVAHQCGTGQPYKNNILSGVFLQGVTITPSGVVEKVINHCGIIDTTAMIMYWSGVNTTRVDAGWSPALFWQYAVASDLTHTTLVGGVFGPLDVHTPYDWSNMTDAYVLNRVSQDGVSVCVVPKPVNETDGVFYAPTYSSMYAMELEPDEIALDSYTAHNQYSTSYGGSSLGWHVSFVDGSHGVLKSVAVTVGAVVTVVSRFGTDWSSVRGPFSDAAFGDMYNETLSSDYYNGGSFYGTNNWYTMANNQTIRPISLYLIKMGFNATLLNGAYGTFDKAAYAAAYPEQQTPGVDAFDSYIATGYELGLDMFLVPRYACGTRVGTQLSIPTLDANGQLTIVPVGGTPTQTLTGFFASREYIASQPSLIAANIDTKDAWNHYATIDYQSVAFVPCVYRQ